MPRRKKTLRKDDETRIESYGRGEFLDMNVGSGDPVRDLWSAVILQAMVNIFFKRKNYQEDLHFLSGGRNFPWICEQLGLNEKLASIGAIKMAHNRAFFRFKNIIKNFTRFNVC